MIKMPVQMSKFFPQKDKIIGLDIGCSSLKLAEFTQRAGRPALLGLKMQEIDLQKDAQTTQLEALKRLLAGIDTKEARVNVVINCAKSCTRILELPYMPKSEIREALKWEMENFISFPVNEAVLDYEILGETSDAGAKKLKIAVACSSKKTVDMYLDLLALAGIQPGLFTLSGFALKNIIASLAGDKNETIAVLDIGYNFSEFFIFEGKSLRLSRKLPVAGGNFTQGMCQALVSERGKMQLTAEEAENIKQKYGIPDSGSSAISEAKISNAQVTSLLRPNLEKLAREIEHSLDFYREKEHGPKSERLMLLGGGSNLRGLAENLSENLNLPVELGNPLAGLLSEESALFKENAHSAHKFAQAIGVALVSAGAVNLLPVEIKEQTKLMVERSSLKVLVSALITILALSYIGMNLRLTTYEKYLGAARLELSALAAQTEEVKRQSFLVKVLKQRLYWSDALKEIGNHIPEGVRLLEMRTQAKALVLKGEIASSGLAEEKLLSRFMDSLGKGIFKEVNLIRSKKGLSEGAPYTFELKVSF